MTGVTILHLAPPKGLTIFLRWFEKLAFLLRETYLVAVRQCLAAMSILLIAWSGFACATDNTPAPPPDLYRDAMLAITEGRLGDAEKTLQTLVAEEPRHAGAWLDLAILYCAMGNTTAAEDLFIEIENRFAPPPPILEVIASQRKRGCLGRQPQSLTTLRLGRGTESNVNQGARNPNFSIGSGSSQIDLVLLPAYRPQGDQFTNLSAEVVRDFSYSGASGVVQFQSKSYDRLSQFNTNALFVGVEQPWRWGNWGWRAAGSTGFMTLDSKVYLRQSQLQLEAAPPLKLPSGWQFGVTGSWSHIAYPTLSGFDANWWEGRSTLTYRDDNAWLQASAGAVLDRQLSIRPGGDRTGTFAGLHGRMVLGNNIVGEMGWQLQNWRGAENYFPGLIDIQRKQATQTLRIAAILPLTDQQSIHLEFRDIRNDENISFLSYRDRILQLNWQWQPFKTK